MSAAPTGNLFHVSAIFTQKALWEVLRYLEAQQAYSVEVRPVAPPTGLLEAPAAAPADIPFKNSRAGSASGKIREEIVKALLEAGEVHTAEFRKRGHSLHDVSNAVFYLTKRKLMKKMGPQHYKATPRLLNAGRGE